MNQQLANELHDKGLLQSDSFQKITTFNQHEKLFSLHWEIKTLLYLGVLLLSGGLGILVYKNIDTIGHQAILAFIALVSIACFVYCNKKKLPFSTGKVNAPNTFFDYILLLGCLTFITFIAYLQFQYQTFGTRFGLATFIPVPVLFFAAYYFDHLGVLSMAIVNLAAWIGISLTPATILQDNDFENTRIILSGLGLGALLSAVAWVSLRQNIKRHFAFTYNNFGMHLLFIASLAAMFNFNHFYFLWFLLLAVVTYFFYRKANSENSFYLILIATLYAYIGISYVVVQLLFSMHGGDEGAIYLGLIYFIGSAIGLILFLINANKKLKTHDSVQ